MHSVFEICAGGGGQSLGLERAGYEHVGAVEIDAHACNTLSANRPHWNVIRGDVRTIRGSDFRGITLFAGGVPCPPFSIAGKQLGSSDSRDLFPEALRLIEESQPEAVMLENVPGFASERFSEYRRGLLDSLRRLGYDADFKILNSSSFGVAQLRPRFILVGLRNTAMARFEWPIGEVGQQTVGKALGAQMASNGWPGAAAWTQKAKGIGPTLVGGSKLHGGPDLGPTRARAQWAALGVDGRGLADAPPSADHPMDHVPRLTVPMTATLQGFPKTWKFTGGKTAAYRQVGNAFPPPVAHAVGAAIMAAVEGTRLDASLRAVAGTQTRLFERFHVAN